VDPFAEKKSPWPKIIIVLILLTAVGFILNKKGIVYKYTGFGTEVTQSTNSVPPVVSTNLPPAKP